VNTISSINSNQTTNHQSITVSIATTATNYNTHNNPSQCQACIAAQSIQLPFNNPSFSQPQSKYIDDQTNALQRPG
jgi:hypothetical protein